MIPQRKEKTYIVCLGTSGDTSIYIFLFDCFFVSQCTKTNQSYQTCERADLDYLACSLVVYQSYTFCAELLAERVKTTMIRF